MMPAIKLEKIYDQIADSYNQKASADVLLTANNKAFSLITHHFTDVSSLNSILALGIGDGISLLPYKEQFSKAALYGLDLSENMLEKAKRRLDCETFHGNIAQASSVIPKTDFDLILAHFISAYVPLPVTLQECKKLLGEKGVVSIVTNTMMSFPKLHVVLKKLKKSYNPFNKLVSSHVNRAMKTVYVPDDLVQLQSMFKASGFELLELTLMEIKIKLDTEQDFFDFFIEGGWFASGLYHSLLPKSLFYKIIKRIIYKHVPLPYGDSMFVASGVAFKQDVSN